MELIKWHTSIKMFTSKYQIIFCQEICGIMMLEKHFLIITASDKDDDVIT